MASECWRKFFCYLFRRSLVRVLSRVARERSFRVILSTHSPFIVRGAPTGASVYWLDNGVVCSKNRHQVELALGWGAFGKKVLVISEDSNTDMLRRLIAQWPAIDKFVAFHPGTGFKHLPTATQAAAIAEALGGKYKIIVHRDRDSLTDAEVKTLQDGYEKEGVFLWFPRLSDVESYFCSKKFLSSFLGVDLEEANQLIDGVLEQNIKPIRDQFDKQRKAHNEEIHTAGGSPKNDDVWAVFQERPLRGAKGKFVFNQLKNKIPKSMLNDESVLAHATKYEQAKSLRSTLERLLAD